MLHKETEAQLCPSGSNSYNEKAELGLKHPALFLLHHFQITSVQVEQTVQQLGHHLRVGGPIVGIPFPEADMLSRGQGWRPKAPP